MDKYGDLLVQDKITNPLLCYISLVGFTLKLSFFNTTAVTCVPGSAYPLEHLWTIKVSFGVHACVSGVLF